MCKTHIHCFSEIGGFGIVSDDLTQLILGVDRVGTCDESPANHPEIARLLAESGIDSISIKAAGLYRAISVVYEAERALGSAKAAE